MCPRGVFASKSWKHNCYSRPTVSLNTLTLSNEPASQYKLVVFVCCFCLVMHYLWQRLYFFVCTAHLLNGAVHLGSGFRRVLGYTDLLV